MADLVTVIMPTYNRADYIADAVVSVLGQSYKNIELVVIDDGSTDNTKDILKPFTQDKRIQYVSQKNAGASAARNRGLLVGRGKYVAFIDSDDIWEPDKLSMQMKLMNALPEIALVCSDFSAINSHGQMLERSHIQSYFSVFKEYGLRYEDVFGEKLDFDSGINNAAYFGNVYGTLLFGNFILTSTCLCHRRVFESVGEFDTKYKTLEDYDLYLRIVRKHAVAFIDLPLVRYRYSDNQLSGADYFGKVCENLIDIFQKSVDAIDDEAFLRENKKRIKRHTGLIQASQGYYYFSHENMALASATYRASIRNNPLLPRSYAYLFFSLLPERLARALKRMKRCLKN